MLTFKPSVLKSNWNATYTNTTAYCEDSEAECGAVSGVTKGEISLRNMWYKNQSLKHYASPQNISYLPKTKGKMAIFDKKKIYILHVLQCIKHQKRRVFLKVYLHYRRAQLKDEDCLATPDPTTSTFLYWINTNRMGTAKNFFAMFLY